MADYHPLISRAVAGLDANTGEARRSLYERARAALVGQLRSVTPALSESEITRERLALEEAIRKVEAEQARRGRLERASPVGNGSPRAEPSESHSPERHFIPASLFRAIEDEPPPARPASSEPMDEGPIAGPATEAHPVGSPAARLDAEHSEGPGQAPDRKAEGQLSDLDRPLTPAPRERPKPPSEPEGSAAANELESARLDEALRHLRKRMTPGRRNEVVPSWPRVPPPDGRSAKHLDDAAEARADQPVLPHKPPDDAAAADSPEFMPAEDDAPPPDSEFPLRERRQRWSGLAVKLLIAIVVLGVLGALAAVGYRERDSLVALYHLLREPSAPVTRDEAKVPKIEDRVGPSQPDRLPGTEQRTASVPATQPPPAVAQRVVLYEEDPNDPNGKRYVGSVIWRTETVSPGPGLAPELAVKANIEIPERRITMSFTMVRNADTALPASHTIDVRFNLPPGFAGGGVANVPGILMKQAEQTRGVPLAGIAVKVTGNVFLIGLSSVEADVQRNTQLLKERTWFDIPIVYSNGSRAILAMEKGTPGERAFNDAFTAWGRPTAAR
jgi:hypothetical protein